ncbi:MAG TPA: 1-deoxy-D-xylulose-5-phosphate synthase [Armatimonadota bacterium]|nr:1-deoxy-D-xylulose-5-phosphate synthase [Armatimonadota bacterium]
MSSLLEQINSPQDLKRVPSEQLQQLAGEIRQFMLRTLAKTGGHLGSNLGVVELTIALHYIFESPRDRIVWDVSHQCYTHKILTGRREQFHSLRQLDGISGFAKRCESEHDAFDAGHGGTSISVALGMARARALQHLPGRVVAVIGDGALTSGLALEALNDAGHSELNNLLLILNDNEMAISPNVGAMARYLSRIRSEPGYLRVKENFEALMQRLPGGGSVVGAVERLKAAVKQIVTPGMLFEELGFTYLGPIDGHDLPTLLNALQQAQRVEGPKILHVLTTKGKGYLPAEHHHSRLHGVGAFDLDSGKPKVKASGTTFTETFGTTVCRLAKQDAHVVAISAAMCDGTGLEDFHQQFPERFFDVGMAEEHAVTLAAGMACEGMRPITAIYSTFSQRAFDQLLHDVCLPNLPVVLALDRAGLVGEDGPTHHGVFDYSFLRMMPNMTVMAPATLAELGVMLETAIHGNGPCALRYPKGRVRITDAGELDGIAQGKAAVLQQGNDIALIAIGSMVEIALDVAGVLAEHGMTATVINARFVKPLDADTLIAAVKGLPQVITLEENVVVGGFGSAVQELFASHQLAIPVHMVGIPDEFIEHGPRSALLSRLQLTPAAIADRILANTGTALQPRP